MPRKTTAKKSSSKQSITPTPVKGLQINKVQLRNSLIILGVVLLLFYLKGLFVAATVNGRPITRLAVVQELEKNYAEQTLDTLISRALIRQEAQKRNISVSDEEAEAEVKKIEKSLQDQGQNFNQALEAQNLTRADLRDRLKVELTVEKMLKDKVKITDQQVDQFLASNKETLPADLSQEQLRTAAKQQLESQQINTEAQKLLTELKQKAKINYFVSY